MSADLEIEVAGLTQRATQVQKLLRPLRKKDPVACAVCREQFRNCKVIAAHDGMAQSGFRDWRFRTCAENIKAQYFELWMSTEDETKLKLTRAYLNIYTFDKDSRNFEKLLSIHSDPYEFGKEPHCLYKQGPHIHVQQARQPMPKCHFPLNYLELERVLSSVDNITEAFEKAIEVVHNEVLERFAGTGM